MVNCVRCKAESTSFEESPYSLRKIPGKQKVSFISRMCDAVKFQKRFWQTNRSS